jgi:hypothetical protein
MDEHSEPGGKLHESPPSPAGGYWSAPMPEAIPAPTYWPAVVAFGCALAGFGVLTSYIFSILGGIILIVSIANWIGEMIRGQ